MTDSQCPAYAGNYVSLYLFLLFIAQKNSLENIGQLDMLTLMFKNISITVKQQRYII